MLMPRFFKKKKKMPENENTPATEEPKEQTNESATPANPLVDTQPSEAPVEDSQEEKVEVAEETAGSPAGQPCPECKGTGLVTPEKLCDNCNGSGKV